MIALDPATSALGAEAPAVAERLSQWERDRASQRLWAADPTFWPNAPATDVASRTGWLTLPEGMRSELPGLRTFAEAVRAQGFGHAVVLGMGGSSLAPDVLRRMYGGRNGSPEMIVLDSTHPAAVRAVLDRIDPARTLFLVSSKSGTTTEPLDLYRFFRKAVEGARVDPGPRFAAVTDPGSPLDALATKDRFRGVFRAVPTVGGRYSALTMFGLVPAALLGVDLGALLDQAGRMASASGPSIAPSANPGLLLGATLGEIAVRGRDKLTVYAAGSAAPFPIWAEQLVAESTGKQGRGIVPIVDEPFADATTYGSDRLFVELQPAGSPDAKLAEHTARLEAVGHPVLRLTFTETAAVGQEFFRWEVGVASAGAILGINPFDQPDVELAKELAREAMARPAAPGTSPGGREVGADDPAALAAGVARWLGSARPRDYVAVQAYLAPTDPVSAALDALRRVLLHRTRLATTVGFGPRFLHSTGQLHKGGPNTGLFLQIVDTPAPDLEVPGAGYTFGQLIRAQSLGDLQALQQKGRRVLRVQLGTDVAGGLERLTEACRA
ncbi:MAG TPA: glucose-6-phosphate isomerase [Thermoplasmata archaeon]|nr:glucose-6-phosphate isomerase [Thermoplasmata archaeon]